MAQLHNHSGRDHAHEPDGSGHAHGAGHSHAAGHVHAPADFGRAFALGITLNIVFVMIEASYGYISGSMALVADAGHNLSDVLGLAIAWIGAILARRKPSERYTYGLRGASILAALANAVILLVAVGAIAWEAIWRFANPEPIAGGTVIVVASIGIVVNGVTAWLFMTGRKTDLNIRGAYLHMVADAAVSVGVVVAGVLILLTGWLWLDAAVSLVIAALIVWTTWSLLRESTAMSLAAVPTHIDPVAVRRFLIGYDGVADLHDLHIWSMSTTDVAMTCHLVVPRLEAGDAYLQKLASEIKSQFGIGHVTIQIERDREVKCALGPGREDADCVAL